MVGDNFDRDSRYCTYEIVDAFGRQTVEVRRIRVDDSCPTEDPGEDDPSFTIPSMATLESSERDRGEWLCRYKYLGVRYVRRLPLAQSCPLTPHFY